LSQAPEHGWGSINTLGVLALSVLLMAGFIFNELRVKHPLIRLGLFKRRNISGGTAMQLLAPAAIFGMFFYLSIYLQQILGYSPTRSGVANVPFTIMVMLVAGTLARKITKINPKPILVAAPLIVAAGLLYMARLPLHSHYWTDILPGIVLMSSGMAAMFVTNTMMTTSGVSHEESGLVSGLLNTGQQIGGAVGLAVLSVISTTVTKHDMVLAHGDKAALPAALVHGFQRGFMAASLFAFAAAIVALAVVKSQKPTKQDEKQEAETEAESLAAIPGA
jgi:predicted MFS family arabinose efflux permease